MEAFNNDMDFEEVLDKFMELDVQNVDHLPPQDDNLEEVDQNDDDDGFDDLDDSDEGLGDELLLTIATVTKDISAGTGDEGAERKYCAWGCCAVISTNLGDDSICMACYQHYRFKIVPTWTHKHIFQHRSGIMRNLPHQRKCSACNNNLYILTIQDTCYYCVTNKII